MRRGSLYDTQPVLLAAATLTAALARPAEEGFWPKDVEFAFDLYSNWLETRYTDPSLHLEFVQITRWLRRLETQNFAERRIARSARTKVKADSKGAARARYRLQRRGLLFLLETLTQPTGDPPSPPETIFAAYFLRAYRPILEQRLATNRTQAPSPTLRQQLDWRPMMALARQRIRAIIGDLEQRIRGTEAMAQHAQRGLARQQPPDTIIRELDEIFSYQLSHRKSLTELYTELPAEMRQHDLTQGFALRNKFLFKPQLAYYRALEKLLDPEDAP